MRILVLGGIRSGKSVWAENTIGGSVQPGQSVRYLATGGTHPDDASWTDRVAAHRARRPGHWQTVETHDLPTQLRADPHIATLVDDVGGWLTATLDRDRWSGASVAADADDLLDAVAGFAAPLALVSPEVGLTVVPATTAGRRFADELGGLNQRLAALCERVVLVVAGQPLTIKEPT